MEPSTEELLALQLQAVAGKRIIGVNTGYMRTVGKKITSSNETEQEPYSLDRGLEPIPQGDPDDL